MDDEKALISQNAALGDYFILARKCGTWPKKLMQDKDRGDRITREIIVDAYGAEEQAMGWYYYLEEQLLFPFATTCNTRRSISPLHVKDEIDVTGMAPEEECLHESFVTISWEKDVLAVPLFQLTPINAISTPTKEVAED